MAYTTIDKSTDNFSTILYTGNNTYPRSLTGFGHQPDFAWFKHRGIAYWHQTYDSVRGTGTGGGVLYTNRQDAQDDTYKVNSFDSDGVTIPSSLGAINDSGNVVAWSWKANGSSTSSNLSSRCLAHDLLPFPILSPSEIVKLHPAVTK